MAVPFGSPAAVAEAVVARRRVGDTSVRCNGVDFDTEERGYCERFNRLTHIAAHVEWDGWDGCCCAYRAGQLLNDDGKHVDRMTTGVYRPQSDDIIVFGPVGMRCSVCGQDAGHVVVCLGQDAQGNVMVAENTSSKTRGNPRKAGTKISFLREVDPNGVRRTGTYRLAKGGV
jgi:hypothetical protein